MFYQSIFLFSINVLVIVTSHEAKQILDLTFLNDTDINAAIDNSTTEENLFLAHAGPKTRRLIQNDTFIIIKESDYRLRLTCPSNNLFTFDVWGQGEYAGYIMKSRNESGVMTVNLNFQEAQTLTIKFIHFDTGVYKVKVFEGLTTQSYEKEVLDFGIFHYWPSCVEVFECAHCIYSWKVHKPNVPERTVVK